MTYTISRTGKLHLGLMLLATLAVWVFAWWFLADTLQFRYTDLSQTLDPAKWSDGQKTTAYFVVAALLGAPFVAWDLLTELFARYTINDDGVQFSTIGLRQAYAWDTMQQVRRSTAAHESAPRIDVVINDQTPISRWRRFFHRRTVHRLPIYQTVANQEALLATLTSRLRDTQA